MNTRNRRPNGQKYAKRPRAHIAPTFPATSSNNAYVNNNFVNNGNNPKRSRHNVVKLFQHMELGDGVFRATGNVDIFKTRGFLERRKKALAAALPENNNNVILN